MRVNSFARLIVLFVLFAFTGQASDFFKGAQRIGPSASEPQLQQYRLSNGRIVKYGTQIIVKVKKSSIIPSLLERYSPKKHETLSETMILMTFTADKDVIALSEEISAQEGVILAQPNIRSEKSVR